jgi:hypothetical protein
VLQLVQQQPHRRAGTLTSTNGSLIKLRPSDLAQTKDLISQSAGSSLISASNGKAIFKSGELLEPYRLNVDDAFASAVRLVPLTPTTLRDIPLLTSVPSGSCGLSATPKASRTADVGNVLR